MFGPGRFTRYGAGVYPTGRWDIAGIVMSEKIELLVFTDYV